MSFKYPKGYWVNPKLAKPPLNFSGCLAIQEFTCLVKYGGDTLAKVPGNQQF